MLCPKCGSDVGDRLTLCEKCQAAAAPPTEQEQRAAIGSIRPNLKIVRLKPEQSSESAAGDLPVEQAAQSDESTGIAEADAPAPFDQEARRRTLTIFALLLILAGSGLAAFTFRSQLEALLKRTSELFNIEQHEQPDLAEAIQIRVRPDPEDLKANGKWGYAIVSYHGYPFRDAFAKFSKSASTVTVELYTEIQPLGRPPIDQPSMRAVFTFYPGTTELTLHKLKALNAYLPMGEEMIGFGKPYNPKAIGLDIVPRLSGSLGPNPSFRVMFNGSEYRSFGGGEVDFSWKLNLNLPLEIQP